MNSDTGDVLSFQSKSRGASSVSSTKGKSEAEFFAELNKSRNINDLKLRVKKIINDLGFSDFILRHIDNNECCQAVLMTLPDEMSRIYAEENFYEADLMIAYAKQNVHPIFTSQVYKYISDAPFETQLTAINRCIEKLNSRFGFFEFYSIPMKAYSGQGYIQLAITDKGLHEEEFQLKMTPYQLVFRLLCKVINRVITTRFSSVMMSESEHQGISITPKPLYILNRLANTDLTICQLADELCISPITAHQHIAGARKALGVKTNIGAIKKAIKLNLISFH